MDLDRGTCAQSRYLWAEHQESIGRPNAEVRRTLEEARDASIWNPRALPSRALRVLQETLRTECLHLGFHIVDLPKEFDRYLKTGLPDRRLFLDNCHLSHEGIRVAAAATVATIAPLLGETSISADALLRSTPLSISGATQGAAHFAAAIINAHWAQNRDVVRFHCERALTSNPAIATAAEDYLELAVRRAPGWMCASLERLASRSDRLALATLVIGNLAVQPKLMDRDLLDAIAGLLGTAAERRLEDLRCSEYGGSLKRSPLHQPYFALRTMGEREAYSLTLRNPGWPDVFRAYAPESVFALVADCPRPVHLQLCARLDRGQSEGVLTLRINASETLRMSVSERWRSWEFTIPPEAIHRGINEIILRWPTTITEDGRVARAIDQLERGLTPELFPVFGEVHSFWATNLS
jgi:hypothetical protein